MDVVLKFLAFLGAFCAASTSAPAYEILAKAEASALSDADRHAAAKAEGEALDRDEVIRSFPWKGPDGASGLIIVSGQYAGLHALGRCRNLIHIIRHPEDGGVNPTFEARVCRDWGGKWSVEKR